MTAGFVPSSQVVGGLEILPLREGSTPLDMVVLVKELDEDGEVCWSTRFTKDLTTVEAVGALTIALDLERRHALSIYEAESD